MYKQLSRSCIYVGKGRNRPDMWPGNRVHRAESLQHSIQGLDIVTEVSLLGFISSFPLSAISWQERDDCEGTRSPLSPPFHQNFCYFLLVQDTEPHYSRTWLHRKHSSSPKDELICSTPRVHSLSEPYNNPQEGVWWENGVRMDLVFQAQYPFVPPLQKPTCQASLQPPYFLALLCYCLLSYVLMGLALRSRTEVMHQQVTRNFADICSPHRTAARGQDWGQLQAHYFSPAGL